MSNRSEGSYTAIKITKPTHIFPESTMEGIRSATLGQCLTPSGLMQKVLRDDQQVTTTPIKEKLSGSYKVRKGSLSADTSVGVKNATDIKAAFKYADSVMEISYQASIHWRRSIPVSTVRRAAGFIFKSADSRCASVTATVRVLGSGTDLSSKVDVPIGQTWAHIDLTAEIIASLHLDHTTWKIEAPGGVIKDDVIKSLFLKEEDKVITGLADSLKLTTDAYGEVEEVTLVYVPRTGVSLSQVLVDTAVKSWRALKGEVTYVENTIVPGIDRILKDVLPDGGHEIRSARATLGNAIQLLRDTIDCLEPQMRTVVLDVSSIRHNIDEVFRAIKDLVNVAMNQSLWLVKSENLYAKVRENQIVMTRNRSRASAFQKQAGGAASPDPASTSFSLYNHEVRRYIARVPPLQARGGATKMLEFSKGITLEASMVEVGSEQNDDGFKAIAIGRQTRPHPGAGTFDHLYVYTRFILFSKLRHHVKAPLEERCRVELERQYESYDGTVASRCGEVLMAAKNLIKSIETVKSSLQAQA